MRTVIPIIPLKLVMLPGSVYPLHIYEEQYKNMIKYCLNFKSNFGIISQIDTELNDVGCVVKIEKIEGPAADGSYDVIVEGLERFITISSHLTVAGYYEAEIEEYKDVQFDNADIELFKKILDLLNIILSKTNLKLEDTFWQNLKAAKFKSFKVAEKTGLSLKQRQKLITIRNENERLEFILWQLNRVNDFIERDIAMKELISNDGYLN